jgi:hypothetical protein
LILLKSGAWKGSGLGSLKMSPGAAHAEFANNGVQNNKGSTQAEILASIESPSAKTPPSLTSRPVQFKRRW